MASITSIPKEILVVIFTCLQCFGDLTSVAGVCKQWRTAVHTRLEASQKKEEARYRQLPWLLQPSDDAPPSIITSYVSGTTGRRICLPEGVRGRDRFCGSHEGGWVAVAADRGRPLYEFVNLINQAIASIPLPKMLRRSQPTRSEVVDISMVTLSDVPTAKSCIAAAHTVSGYPSIIFCRPQVDAHWVPPLEDTELLQDTLYHKGEVYQGFYSISNRDNLYVFQPTETNNGETLAMGQLAISFPPVLAVDKLRMDGSITTRYLVESRGKLLLVLRYSGRASGIDLRTLHFRVFQLEINRVPNNVGCSAAWVTLNGLDGRVITVARGCSRSFDEAEKYEGFQGGSIYFLDDALGAGRVNSTFSFADLGMYSMGETKIERPGLFTPSLRGCLDGDGGAQAFQGSSAPGHPSQHHRQRWLLRPRNDLAWDGRTEYLRMLAGCEPASNTLYGPRELMVRTRNNVQIVSEIGHVANDDEASSSTSAGGEQVVNKTLGSVWPLLCKPRNRSPIWFLPPSADEWLLPAPPANA